MKTLPPPCVALATLAMSAVASATTIVFTDANAINLTDVSIGSLANDGISITNVKDPNNYNDREISYTIENLDFDGDNLSDSMTVRVLVSSTGTYNDIPAENFDGNATRSTRNGSFGVNSSADTRGSIDVQGEELTFSFGTIDFNLSSGGVAPQVLLTEFTEVRFRSYGAYSSHFLNGNTATRLDANANSDAQDLTGTVDQSTFSLGFANAENILDNDPFRVSSVSFNISLSSGIGGGIIPGVIAVPEPSSTALISLAGMSLILRRRR